MPSHNPTSSCDEALNRILADVLDALGRGEAVDLATWQARFPEYSQELADLLASRAEVRSVQVVADTTPPLSSAAEPTEAGDSLGNLGSYELLMELGVGGMGRVYKARHHRLGRQVALKVIRVHGKTTEVEKMRFRTEAEAAARLDHANIVPVFEVGEHDGRAFLAARYVHGGPLSDHLQRFHGDPRAAAQLLVAVARAMHFAHQRGVLHRDLKPSNVLLEWSHGEAGAPVPLVTDFGLARLIDQDCGLTRTGAIVGTPSYMAPEQAVGHGRAILTTATDIYGLGGILYSMLTGRKPFDGSTMLETLELVQRHEPDSPRRSNPLVDRDLETICLTCLAKDSRRRYASASALADDLENWLAHRPIVARPIGSGERFLKWARRRPAAAIAVCAAVVAIVAGLSASLWHNHVLGEALSVSDQLRQDGLVREANLRDLVYVADLRLAKEAWDAGDLPHLAELLDRQLPGADGIDRRGFEWHWLKWCLGTGRGTLKAYERGLLCAAVSPDDRFLVTGDYEGTVKVWDFASRELITTLVGHVDEVTRAAFSPDSKLLATCGKDKTVRLWDVDTWQQTHELRGHGRTVTALAFHQLGKLLLSGGRDGNYILWEIPTGRKLETWKSADNVVHDIIFHPSGNVVTVGSDRLVRFLATYCRGEFFGFCSTRCTPITVAASPDSKSLAMGGYGDAIDVSNKLGTGAPTLRVPSFWTVRALTFSPSGKQLIAACDSGMLCVWDVAPNSDSMDLARAMRISSGKGRAATYAKNGTMLVTASEEDGVVRFWDPTRFAGYEIFHSPAAFLNNVAISSAGIIASCHNHGLVNFADAENPTNGDLKLTSGNTHWVKLAFSADGQFIAVGGTDHHAWLWDVATRHFVGKVNQGSAISALGISPKGDVFATSSLADGRVRLWSLPACALTAEIATRRTVCLAFAPDGGTLALAGEGHDFDVGFFDPNTGARRAGLIGPDALSPQWRVSETIKYKGENSCTVDALAYSPDGSVLAAACSDGVIRIWDVVSGELRTSFSGHIGRIARVAFAPDGRTLASLGHDKTIRLWHLATGQQLFTLATRPEGFAGLSFSPDGRKLIAGASAKESAPPALMMWHAGE